MNKQKPLKSLTIYTGTLTLLVGLLVVPGSRPGVPDAPLSLPPLVANAEAAAAPASPPPSPSPAPTASQPASVPQPAGPHNQPETAPIQYEYRTLVDPSGPLYPIESFLARISAPGGWAVATSNQTPIIAVIDTGFALSHQALAGRLMPGYSFVYNDNNPTAGRTNPNGSGVSHGTLTAGLASVLSPLAKIMPLQALDDNGSGYTTEVAAAVRYAADNGADVINLSLGTSSDDSYLRSAVQYAIGKGSVVVAAAGNDGCNCMVYPAAWPEVISAGASTASDTRAGFSSYGTNLDVIAPGTASDVCSSLYQASNPISAYSCGYQGTSFAAPLVSSLASLLVQQYPNLTPAQISTAITDGADKVTAMAGQAQTLTEGYGRINVLNSLQAAGTIIGSSTPTQPAFSMAYITLNTGARSDAICTGPVNSTCEIKLIGPSGQTVILGRQAINSFGQTSFTWSATSLGLATGNWHMMATVVAGTQATTLAPQPFVVN